MEEFLTAQAMLLATFLPTHWVYLRQVETNLDLKQKLPFYKGIFGTFLRHHIKGLALYGLYFSYSQYLIKKEVSEIYHKREIHSQIQKARL